MPTVISANQLQKRYGDHVAVHDISFTVQKGEIFGILGPNGAGKTTTVEMVMGLRQPDRGTIEVLGMNPQQHSARLRQQIGIQLQQAALPDNIKVWEALSLFASFYNKTVSWEKLIEQWGLSDKRNARFSKLSGGQKQRLFIALALLNDPEVVFLDELTTGLDPQARRHTWELVKTIQAQGKTVVLVTHFMDEAETLCDRIAVVDSGRIIALDTPQALIEQLNGQNRVRFTRINGFNAATLENLPGVERVEQSGLEVVVYGNGTMIGQVTAHLAQANALPSDLKVEQANLEDVFLALTGKQIRS
ncbi:MAG: ABC transporter ATP-binding protein [Candidatus Promineifilaceae bacterium]